MATNLKEVEGRGPTLDAAPKVHLRGDPITGDRYTSRAFMENEWNEVFAKCWLLMARADDIPEAGDYVQEEIGPESFVFMRQEDGSIKGFYNVCLHRGNRLTFSPGGMGNGLVCAYHGWHWGIDGKLEWAQDPEDFPQGNPCDHLRLKEVKVEVFGGFIWMNMDEDACTLEEFLGPVYEQWQYYPLEKMKRYQALTANIPCNWKVITDNFHESYHLPAVHPESDTFIEEHHSDTQFDLYPLGHHRMLMKGHKPSASLQKKGQPMIQEPIPSMMQDWGLNPDDFQNASPEDIRQAFMKKKREEGVKRGFAHYDKLSDDQLTDFFHYTIFPNFAVSITADGFHYLRMKPHPTDPEKCIFDNWFYAVEPPEGMEQIVRTPAAEVPVGEEVPHEVFEFGEQSLGYAIDQDMSITTGQQLGFRSRAYQDSYMATQEDRIRHYHEVINDYLEGRRDAKHPNLKPEAVK